MKRALLLKIHVLILFFINIYCFAIPQNIFDFDNDTVDIVKNEGRNIGSEEKFMSELNSSIATVKGDELRMHFSTNFGNTLKGKLAGLTVINGEGESGVDYPSFYIRGISTFNSGRSPLVLVDGVECFYDQLIPEEVESVTLLKDASATAIFGSRGANGVILITTKQGKEGARKVTFKAQYGIETPMRLPDFLPSYDYALFFNEALVNDGYEPQYSENDLAAYKNGSDPFFHPNVDWYDQTLKDAAPISKYNLAVSGGSNIINYFVLLNILNREGLLKKTTNLSDFSSNSNYTRYNVRTNINANISKKIFVDFKLGATITDKSNPVDFNTQSLFDLISSIPPNAFPVYNPNHTYGGNQMFSNPWGDMLEKGFYTSNTRTFQSLLKLSCDLDVLSKGLSASALIAFNDKFTGYSSKYRTYRRFSIKKDEAGEIIYIPFGDDTSLTSSEWVGDQWWNFTVQANINYKKTFANSSFAGLLGYNLDTYTISGNNLPFKHIGLNGCFNYTYDEKYIGEFSFGYMGANYYKKGHRFGLFPALSLGWIVSNENFFHEIDYLNYLKLRISYGIVGNDFGIPRYMYEPYYSYTSSYYFGTSNTSMSSFVEGRLPNPNLSWENEKQLNFGADLEILNNLKINFDIFNKNRYNILVEPNQDVPQFLGMTLPLQNIGKVNNKGFELCLGYKKHTNNSNLFYADFNVGYSKNKILYNAEVIKPFEYQNRSGRMIDQPFVLESIGFFNDQEEINNSPKQVFETVKPGDIKYKDQNNDGIIDQNDFYPCGFTYIPEVNFGFSTGFKYKNVDFDIFFQGDLNRTVYLSGKNYHAFQNNGKITGLAKARWTPETSEVATYPRLSAHNNNNNYQYSSFWQKNGNFLKLRDLEFGYSLSKSIVHKIGIQNVRFYIVGSNIFSLDELKISDPEKLSGYPAMKSFSLGTNIQF